MRRLALVLLILVVWFGCSPGDQSPTTQAQSPTPSAPPAPPPSTASQTALLQSPLPNLRITNEVRVHEAVKDAVVNISSTRIVNARVGTGDPFIDQFFGGTVRAVPANSLGSGFVIHPAGYIVTNEHVIDRAADVQVAFPNGEKLPAQVIATDDAHDLAVIKVNPPRPLLAIPLGASDDLMVGEPVYAIGNPFGYAGTMTRGIVSATNRELDFGQEGGGGGGGRVYKDLIQTDASINPGNSGGPLINAYGQVIGINTAIRGDAHGIGFAISVSRLRDLLPSFLNTEAVNRAVIGFNLEERRSLIPPATVNAAIFVKAVHGPKTAKAGLLTGDQILAINSVPTANIIDACVALAAIKPGDTIDLHLARGNKIFDLKAPVDAAPPPESERIIAARLGITGKTVTPALAKSEKLAVNTGMLVTALEKAGPAAKSGIETGDIIFQLGPYYITSIDDAANLLKGADPGLNVRVGVIRPNTRGRTVLQLR